MKPPCVTIVKHVLPAIRVLVVKELIEKYHMRKVDASAKMELTPAAITQYLKGERGTTFIDEVLRSEKAASDISKLAEILAKNDVPMESVIERICDICDTIRSKEVLCELHQKDLPILKESKCALCGRAT